MSIFKACDIRGMAGSEITPALFRRIGRGIALMMGENAGIVVGGDLRLSTPELKATLIEGLTENGRMVTDVGAAPTPLVYFAKSHLSAYACAIVTASHNPPEYNGLKLMLGELPVLPEDLERLRALVAGDDTDSPSARPGASGTAPDVLTEYENSVRSTADRLLPEGTQRVRKLSVVVDAGNGAASEIAPRLIEGMDGIEVHRLFCRPDGRFPNRAPDCAVPENLAALAERVRKTNSDLGIAFDGDGDRVAFVDDSGEVVSADEMMVLFLRAFGKKLSGKKVGYDLKCSQVVAQEAERLGAAPLMEKSGHAFIKRRMILERALFGGEISGHYFHRALDGGDDGLLNAMLTVHLLRQSEDSLSELRKTVPARFITRDIRLHCSPGQAQNFLEALRNAFPETRRTELDGIRVSFPQGWGLLRASITEPKITLRFEGENAASLHEVIGAFLAPLAELRERVTGAL